MFSGLLILGILAFMIPGDSDRRQDIPTPTVQVDPEICPSENNCFTGGERIEYKLYYNLNFIWIPAATVVFNVEDQGDQYHISAVGKTLKSYNWFFKVEDYYDVVLDKETLLPIASTRNVKEGGYKLYEEITYDQEKNKAFSLRGKTKEKAVMREFEVSSCIQDILSVIYHARNLDFKNYEVGQKFPVKIFMDKEEWPLQVSYLGEEHDKKIKGLGKYNTIKFQPEVITGEIFEEGAEMLVWASNDKNCIPLLIESPISVGSVKAVLKSYEGLRHDFTSQTK